MNLIEGVGTGNSSSGIDQLGASASDLRVLVEADLTNA
jgi:hypothetical protein